MISDDFYGDRFKWFIGVVKDAAGDSNRVRVRIFGIHHINDTTNVSDGDLPLAIVLLPNTGGQTGGGAGAHGLSSGSWVVGFFADGDDCQQPVIIGTIGGGFGSTDNSSTPSSGGGSGTVTPGTDPSGGSTGAGTGGGDTPSSGGGGGTANLQGNSNVEKGYNFFREKIEQSGKSSGNVHAQVSGILGNLLEESGMNPGANNPSDKGQRSFGIAQWRAGKYDRLTPLFRFAGTESPSLEQQLSFVWHEFNTTEQSAFKRLMAATNVVEATDAMVGYERPQCWKGKYIDKNDHTYPGRLKKAQQVYNTIQYKPRTA